MRLVELLKNGGESGLFNPEMLVQVGAETVHYNQSMCDVAFVGCAFKIVGTREEILARLGISDIGWIVKAKVPEPVKIPEPPKPVAKKPEPPKQMAKTK